VKDKILGFLGYGNMGAAILEGLLDAGAVAATDALVFDPSPERCAAAAKIDVRAAESAAALAGESDVLVLAVKPQIMDAALTEIAPHVKPGALVVSIAAGTTIAAIQARLGTESKVIRVMPNTPFLVHAGAAGVAPSAQCDAADCDLACSLFAAIGVAEVVEEADMDAVTALSGSGPAYFFRVVECLIDAAEAQGLDRAIAKRLAVQTLFGAGKLLAETGEDAAVLRLRVTSPGGTTEAALNAFAAEGLDQVLAAGVAAAVKRGKELAG
jgi:pyrroline-5-carboxylate reductase